ncbi:RHS domain-containing protein [Rothia aeria]|uniref:RHS domain-containing protein n=1 Tax=Rothia aeria TaxID=172042 RepID=UPI002446A4A5|nr:RHS domain-containing protein [Rothia aeria]
MQEYTYKGCYTYLYTDQDSYEPLAQVFQNNQDEAQYLAYFHNDQIGILREQTDQFGNLLWTEEYDAWGGLKKKRKSIPMPISRSDFRISTSTARRGCITT